MDEFDQFPIHEYTKSQLPSELAQIPEPPAKFFVRGAFPTDLYYITIVGSRTPTSYGRQACEHIVRGLAGYPVVICSGLAIGIDSVAHRSALSAKIPTVAIPGSGLSKKVIYPRQNVQLAYDILSAGGALASEFEPDEESRPYFFPRRNRIMAALSSFVCVIEAKEKSGSLITARLAIDYNKDLGAVPGSIFSEESTGTVKLLREGALPIRSARDILEALSIVVPELGTPPEEDLSYLPPEEALIVKELIKPLLYDELVRRLGVPTREINVTLSLLEMKGIITNERGTITRILFAKEMNV